MNVIFFSNQSEFRKWLEKNHLHETELIVGYYKLSSGKPSMTWSQSVDEAICYGWIDGVRRSIDHESYCIRFTPRNPKSNWSAVNIKKAEELTKKGLMQPAGIKSFAFRKQEKSEIYSYENKPEKLSTEFELKFKSNKKAWDFFESQAPSYKKTFTYWVMSAKQQTTKLRRLNKLITTSEQKQKLY